MDRVQISKSYRSVIDELKQKKILGFEGNEPPASEIFLLAVALGLNSPKDISGSKEGFVRFDTLQANDRAMISAALLGTIASDNELDELADFENSVIYCEKCAESGFRNLRGRVESANWSEDLLEARLLKELDRLYLKNIEDDL